MIIKRIEFIFLLLICCSFFATAQKLVLPGDYPDPSVVKIGDTYWASATTSNWMPAYPLLKSKDLIHWETTRHVFNQLPAWVDYYFWAPEISYENGKVYIYYSAHKKDGNLCVGVASADQPEGPYRDHGPLICQEVGSIDAFPMRDEKGKLYIIWKEDANSVNKPTPIWIQEMNEERTALIGEKRELFRNNAPWEGNLVEGVSMIRYGDYYYAIYAAAGCCGDGCTYTTGIARAKSLFGPWEKYEKNPVLTSDDQWKCPGHGTAIEKDGKYYFLYHAYSKESDIYTGRQGLLIEFKFTQDNWIEFIKEKPSTETKFASFQDDFKGRSLLPSWQWSVFQQINKKVKRGSLQLGALPSPSGAFLGQKILDDDFVSTAVINLKKSNAQSGIALIGDERNSVSLLINKDSIKLIQFKDNKETNLLTQPISKGNIKHLRIQVRNGKEIMFLYSNDGNNFTALNEKPIDGSYLPPWDRAVRVGIVSKGVFNAKTVVESFEINYN